MSFLRYAVPVLAAAGIASAASCSVSATTTIQNAGDATGLASCKTFTGSIAISTGTTDSIALDGIQEIQGDLVANNVTELIGLSGSSLKSITGQLNLNEVTRLNTLNFPELTTVDSIIWNALPNLQSLTFTASVQTANTVNIQNTGLQSLDGISLDTVDTFYLANNRYIDTLDLSLGMVGNSLIIEANKGTLAATFTNLSWANNMTFRNVSTVSLPQLVSVNGSLGFYGDSFESFSAPNLTSIGKTTQGSLTFQDCEQISNISLPLLSLVGGGFEIGNNPELHNVSLPALKTIGGALDFHGNLTDIEMPALQDVKGAFNVQSTGDITDACNNFATMKKNGVIEGKYECAGLVTKPGGTGTTPTSSGATATKTSAAGHLDVSSSAVMGITGVLAAMFGLL